MKTRNFKDIAAITLPEYVIERIEELMYFEDEIYKELGMLEWERMNGYELLEYAIIYPDYGDSDEGICEDFFEMFDAKKCGYLDDWKEKKMDQLREDNPQLYKAVMTKKHRLNEINDLLDEKEG
ncbi:hypothetical protein [Marixanthomonas spongiae]|uniref:Uncharacterized protein n=1 Tax=Marixanthomonas spongiae TaxID=2174845 RepID=A0A2U0HUB8_9FLAO|nr:hypothetical protein [Marixanthomonas spongiae]PVW12419.1 hypothetical protein DDV96_15010 [Marixanthomonas spongiae]